MDEFLNLFTPTFKLGSSSLVSKRFRLRALACIALATIDAQANQTLYVAPDGARTGDGSRDRPHGSLAQALKLAKSDPDIVEIVLADGFYALAEPILLENLDRRGETALVVRAADGAQPVLSGGTAIEAGWEQADPQDPVLQRMPAKMRNAVQVIHLGAYGISDFGELQMHGFTERRTAPGELFLGYARAPVAGWPNPGVDIENETLKTEHGHWLYGQLSEGHPHLPPEKAARWKGIKNLWAHGYWGTDWADFHLPVTVEGSVLRPGQQPHFGVKDKGALRIYNLPEELDHPGEWYLDRASSRLYLLPQTEQDPTTAVYSRLEEPLLKLKNSHNLAFVGLTFAHSRGALVSLQDTSQVTLEGCRFHASGLEAVRVEGVHNEIVGCRFQHIGESAILLGGGDKKSLARARNHAVHNVISHYGERYYSYSAGAKLTGVGNVFAHNRVFEAPHEGVQINGNLHLVFRNEIHDVCRYSDDAGAIYSGRDWSGWGNRIIENFIHDIRTQRGSRDWVHGVYLDDCASGFTVRRNIFLRIDGFGTNLGGGRSNRIESNFFAFCGGAHLNDNRGSKWIRAEPGSSWNPFEALAKVPYQEEPWRSTFPALSRFPRAFEEARPYFLPVGTTFANNAGSDNEKWADLIDWTGAGVEKHYARYDPTPIALDAKSTPAHWSRGDERQNVELPDGKVLPFPKMGTRQGPIEWKP